MRSRSVLFLAFLALGGPAEAQAPDAPQPVQAFEETIDVQAVNLEAVVTDGRGKRVTGLALKDFRLLVDGVEIPITYFSEIREERQRVQGEIASGEGVRPAPEAAWQSRNILVFLDEATMLKARRDFVVRSLAKQIENLTSGDQMAIVAFSGSQLEVICNWTDDRARLASVLAGIERRPSGGIHMEAARREEISDAGFQDMRASQEIFDRNPWGNPFTERTNGTLPASPTGALDIEEENFSTARWLKPPKLQPTQLFNPLNQYLEVGEAAAGAMRGLPAPPGRKMLMLLTEGFQDPVFAQPVIQEAGRLGYSLYPVDVKGLDTFQAQNDVEHAAPQAFISIASDLDRGIDYTLATMAAATGGKASLNSNRLAALERLVEDSSS
ncbi:MAG: VWA domain-containing protein, partial [Thermoanaerobaculia bacterium]